MKKLIFLLSFFFAFAVTQAQNSVMPKADTTVIVPICTDSSVIAETVAYSDSVKYTLKTDVIDNIMGSLTLSDYLSAFFFAMIGLFLRHVFMIRKGVKCSTNDSPTKFSWAYWFKNNFMTKLTAIGSTVAIIFLCLRFSVDWFSIEVSMGFAFIIGLAFDWFYDFVRKLQDKVPVPPKAEDKPVQ